MRCPEKNSPQTVSLTLRKIACSFTMMLQSIRVLEPCAKSDVRDTNDASAKECGEDPTTLLGLLLRAARLWPSNGITFKDQGWDHDSDFTTYADLLEEAEVSLLTSKNNIKSAN